MSYKTVTIRITDECALIADQLAKIERRSRASYLGVLLDANLRRIGANTLQSAIKGVDASHTDLELSSQPTDDEKPPAHLSFKEKLEWVKVRRPASHPT